MFRTAMEMSSLSLSDQICLHIERCNPMWVWGPDALIGFARMALLSHVIHVSLPCNHLSIHSPYGRPQPVHWPRRILASALLIVRTCVDTSFPPGYPLYTIVPEYVWTDVPLNPPRRLSLIRRVYDMNRITRETTLQSWTIPPRV